MRWRGGAGGGRLSMLARPTEGPRCSRAPRSLACLRACCPRAACAACRTTDAAHEAASGGAAQISILPLDAQ